VQQRREWPARATQRIQLLAQKHLIAPVLEGRRPVRAPWLLRALSRSEVLRRIPAYMIGVGVRPEHVH
ncbi:MAG TPA: FAD-dependent oxidoreductase, partial [Burkholderiaceae bacterium]